MSFAAGGCATASAGRSAAEDLFASVLEGEGGTTCEPASSEAALPPELAPLPPLMDGAGGTAWPASDKEFEVPEPARSPPIPAADGVGGTISELPGDSEPARLAPNPDEPPAESTEGAGATTWEPAPESKFPRRPATLFPGPLPVSLAEGGGGATPEFLPDESPESSPDKDLPRPPPSFPEGDNDGDGGTTCMPPSPIVPRAFAAVRCSRMGRFGVGATASDAPIFTSPKSRIEADRVGEGGATPAIPGLFTVLPPAESDTIFGAGAIPAACGRPARAAMPASI